MKRLGLLSLFQFDFNPFILSQVIYQLRLPSNCKFFTFKHVNLTIKKNFFFKYM